MIYDLVIGDRGYYFTRFMKKLIEKYGLVADYVRRNGGKNKQLTNKYILKYKTYLNLSL